MRCHFGAAEYSTEPCPTSIAVGRLRTRTIRRLVGYEIASIHDGDDINGTITTTKPLLIHPTAD